MTEAEERVALLKSASKLTIAFRVWTIVVGIFGTAALLYLREIKAEITHANTVHTATLERLNAQDEREARLDERQQYMLQVLSVHADRINKLEDDTRQRRER